MFAVGWGFGRAYRKATSQGGFWLALYALMAALSVYFVMQGLAAFAVRALLLGAVMWLGWRYATGVDLPAQADRARPRPGARRELFRSRLGTAP